MAQLRGCRVRDPGMGGSTTEGSWSPSATYRLPKPNNATTVLELLGLGGAHQKPYLQDQSIDLNQERLYWPVATLQLGMRQVLLVIYGILCRQRIVV